MKKGQVYEGIIESVEFPNKGRIYVPEEDRWVVVVVAAVKGAGTTS